MKTYKKGNPTVAELIAFLKQFDGNAKVWGYEGEVSGIIVAEKNATGTFHNDGTQEISNLQKLKKNNI